MNSKKLIFTALAITVFVTVSFAQNSDFVKTVGSGRIDATNSQLLVKDLNEDHAKFFKDFKTLVSTPANFTKAKGDLSLLLEMLHSGGDGYLDDIENGKNSAVIFVYRDMKNDGTNTTLDFESLNSLVYHKSYKNSDKNDATYLLGTKKVIIVFIDIVKDYYDSKADDRPKSLDKTTIKIKYNTSFFSQSFTDLTKLVNAELGSMGGNKAVGIQELELKIVEIDPKRVKAPCDIILNNKFFKSDLSFTIHEKNMASFQVGLSNDQINVNNFSISNGNLVVTPDSTQKKNWKSNINAMLVFHAPWDIDNFQPIWKAVFAKDPDKRTVGHYLYKITIERIGVYGGLKISKDPLSNIYAGINYAITKEISLTAGYVWTNDVQPQITSIGNITSLSDATKYAKRSYSKAQFSWGVSFSPSSVISMLGLGKKTEK